MDEVKHHKLLTREEECELARKIQEEDCQESFHRLVTANLRFVIKICHDFKCTNVPFEELIEEGNIGLMTAASKYRPNPDCKFSTYSQWWIKQKIRRYINNNICIVRTPHQSMEKIKRIQNVIDTYTEEHGVPPSAKYIAKTMGHNEKSIVGWLSVLKKSVIELDSNAHASASEGPYDFYLKDVKKYDSIFFSEIDMREKMEILKGIISELSENEIIVLSMRFGLFEYDKPHTLELTSHAIGRTRERVRQIEKGALERIKSRLTEMGIKDEFKNFISLDDLQ
jgi:RNA polymerase sigma factor (sigma-70 family)